MLLKLQCTLEIDGEAKPALVAEVLCMLLGKPDAGALLARARAMADQCASAGTLPVSDK
jgi:hypothetical protein